MFVLDPLNVTLLARLPHKWLMSSTDERCLLLHGKTRDDGSSTVTGWERTVNLHPDPAKHFRVMFDTDDDRIIGVLHTHVDRRCPHPSDDDRRSLPWWMIGAVYCHGSVEWFTSSQ